MSAENPAALNDVTLFLFGVFALIAAIAAIGFGIYAAVRCIRRR